MKLPLLNRVALALISVAVLASCGGGSDADEAGSPVAFNVQPADVSGSGTSPTTCYSGFLAEVFVYGGAAPYYINNTFPDVIILNKNKVESAGGSFTITLNGGCFDPGTVVVVDRLNKQVSVTVHNKLGS